MLSDYKAGREVARLDLTRLGDQRYLFVHRHDLVTVLVQAAEAAGVTLRLGQAVASVVPGDAPHILLESGAQARADVVICADGLHSVGRQVISAGAGARFTGQVAWRATVPVQGAAAEARGVNIFINARTDLFLKEPDEARHEALLKAAIEREAAYRQAGASGFFVPRLADRLVAQLCDAVTLPVNVMATSVDVDVMSLTDRGVSRISHGPFPFIEAMAEFEARAKIALQIR